ncbi:hypothetical protein [Burkholderia ambifaria]|uniref:hypothetical protein n=1 Tax=Burkholderia ambifaria TaxID=152480 RepID=UPI00158911FD|nr:hypothetical protein [Burkholderia ambifaria]
MSENNNTCIYCGSLGPFSDEHVIPAGLGADDKRYLLQDMVCKECNTTVFSPLELAFLRRSPTALGRIFMQPEGRKRGGKGDAPKLDATSKVLVSEDGHTSEIELTTNGKPIILPQLILVADDRCTPTGTDREGLTQFILDARGLLGDNALLASRIDSIGKAAFNLIRVMWNGDKYVEQERLLSNQLPKPHIWETIIELGDNGKPKSNTRLFQRPDGQIVLRVADGLGSTEALTRFRLVLDKIDLSDAIESEVKNPLVHLNLPLRTDVTSRVLAKIGVNLLAHLLGPDYARLPQLQEIKSSIRSGTPGIPYLLDEGKEAFKKLFAGLPDKHHGFLLTAIPETATTCTISVVTQLYGSQIEAVPLGRALPSPNIALPTIFTVDFTNHSVEQHSMIDYISKYPPNFKLKPH